jgi:hypothetical protein
MPYTTTYVDEGRGVLKTGSGLMTGIDFFSTALQQSLDVERTRKLLYALADFTDVTEMKVTPGDMRRLSEMNRKTAAMSPGALIAIVAPSTISFAMARVWHSFSEDNGWKANVFHARPEAIAWLKKELHFLHGETMGPDQFPYLYQAP